MKKILIPAASDTVNHYRTNLHCHSTISDGAKTIEEIKAFYKKAGYSVVAFTDHNAFLRHNDLTDEHFLALNGYEIDFPVKDDKTCHLCLIAPTADTAIDPCYHREKYIWGNANNYRPQIGFDESKPDCERVNSHEGVNEIIRRGRDAGFFVTYNHPTWSREDYPEYSGYVGMNAMEMINYGCVVSGYEDDNGRVYNDMLRLGRRLYCIAADDNHNHSSDDSVYCDSFGGATVLFAEKLDYDHIMAALREGHFYAVAGTSAHRGPEIKSLWVENGVVTVETSPAHAIHYIPNSRGCRNTEAKEGETVTSASFTIRPGEAWFRLTVTDASGYKAYTNAYFPEADWFAK